MNRYFAVCLALTGGLLPPLAAADPAPEVTLRWYGQSFFQLTTSKGTRVVFDPHAIDAYGRPKVDADLVLISHQHNDHTQVGELANQGKFKVIPGLVGTGRKQNWNKVDETFRDIHVRAVPTYHDNSEGMERGKNTAFVVRADGLTFVHLGDLGHELSPAQVKAIGPVDVLMVPAGGVYALNGTEAAKVIEQLKPRLYAIPMHYGTRVYEDLLPLDEFLEGRDDVDKKTSNVLKIANSPNPGPMRVAVLTYPK
jgi:L-ascorbate metabolism protein UlaG (beta-lactamase superfamily)